MAQTVGAKINNRQQRLAKLLANRLEVLKGNRAGQYSIRINDQFRVCFRWLKGHAEDVEIVADD